MGIGALAFGGSSYILSKTNIGPEININTKKALILMLAGGISFACLVVKSELKKYCWRQNTIKAFKNQLKIN